MSKYVVNINHSAVIEANTQAEAMDKAITRMEKLLAHQIKYCGGLVVTKADMTVHKIPRRVLADGNGR